MQTYAPGTLIAGRYEIAGRPLMGGMGIVYICLDHEENRPVALKTFKPEYLPDRAARDRFLREGTAWVDLGAHPHVVRCYDVLYIDPEVYLILELVAKAQGCEDASLRGWLMPGQPLPVEQALLFALQIARGMAHAAATIPGFVHRDLKPENVLVGADRLSNAPANRLRVTDFGLAAVLQASTDITSHISNATNDASRITHHEASSPDQSPNVGRTQLTHGIVGTPRYMAPEQWRGEPVTVATDVYALGCILYEMLAGQRATAGRSLPALQRAHCEGDLRPLPAGLPEGVYALLTRFLALEPGERYGVWAQVEAALVTAYEEVACRPAPAAEPVAILDRAERVAAGWSYSAMGLSYLDIGKAEVALDYFERARAVGSDEGARTLESAALGNLGVAYKNLGDARCAIKYYEQALAILREVEDRNGEGNALMDLGSAYANLGDARRAIGYYEQALTIAREIGDRRGEGNNLGNLGNAYAALGRVRCAIGYYEQHLVITREVGDRNGEGNALMGLGSAYLQLGDARRAIGYYEQALATAREIGDRRGEGYALGNLGNAYAALGDARRAIGYYEQALAIAREVGDRREEGRSLNNMGEAYRELGDARRAIGYYEQALVVAREIGGRRGEGVFLGNMGTSYLQLGDARRAIRYYERRLEIAREIGDRRGESAGLGNLGSAYLQLDDVRRAIKYWQSATAIFEEIGDVMNEMGMGFNLAVLLTQQERTAEALPYARRAAQVFAQIGHVEYAQRAQQLVAQLQGGGTSADDPAANAIQQAFDAFQRADSPTEMQHAVAQYPLLADSSFITTVELTIAQQVPPERRPAFEQHLAWLRQIAQENQKGDQP